MYESELNHHISQQDQIDESVPCRRCGQPVYLRNAYLRDLDYHSEAGGVVHNDCPDVMTDDAGADGLHPTGSLAAIQLSET